MKSGLNQYRAFQMLLLLHYYAFPAAQHLGIFVVSPSKVWLYLVSIGGPRKVRTARTLLDQCGWAGFHRLLAQVALRFHGAYPALHESPSAGTSSPCTDAADVRSSYTFSPSQCAASSHAH